MAAVDESDGDTEIAPVRSGSFSATVATDQSGCQRPAGPFAWNSIQPMISIQPATGMMAGAPESRNSVGRNAALSDQMHSRPAIAKDSSDQLTGRLLPSGSGASATQTIRKITNSRST
ncbi:MAG: hypothetical protein ACMVY4_09130 [Minwuia sp.]|uniref:hypothetical protein n=1 Tax=Minwuia sp. TaxID=2493630 RepID=UPI003A8A132E